MSQLNKPCTNGTPPWFTGHWRDWHRGHGCDRDDAKPRSEDAKTEIAQHDANAATGFLTDAELRMLRASTTSGNGLLIRALDELSARRASDRPTPSSPGMAMGTPEYMAPEQAAGFDHSDCRVKQWLEVLGFCVCKHCTKLPEHEEEGSTP